MHAGDQACSLEDYGARPLSLEEMIVEVEANVSRRAIEGDRQYSEVFGYPPTSYLYNLGYVFGTINEGLTYAFQVL
jgi:hypothetical protein